MSRFLMNWLNHFVLCNGINSPATGVTLFHWSTGEHWFKLANVNTSNTSFFFLMQGCKCSSREEKTFTSAYFTWWTGLSGRPHHQTSWPAWWRHTHTHTHTHIHTEGQTLVRKELNLNFFLDAFKGFLYQTDRHTDRHTAAHTWLCPGGRQTGWCRQVSEEKRFSLSGPAASASHSVEKPSWPGTGCTAPHWTTPGGRRQRYFSSWVTCENKIKIRCSSFSEWISPYCVTVAG